MKKIILIFLVLLTSKVCGQQIIGKSYITTIKNIMVTSYNLIQEEEVAIYRVPQNVKFTVDNFIDGEDSVLITFWGFNAGKNRNNVEVKALNNVIEENTDPSKLDIEIKGFLDDKKLLYQVLSLDQDQLTNEDIELKLNNNYEFIGSWANHLQFKMKLSDLNNKTREYYGKSTDFTFGVMTLPVKIRFGNKEERFFNFEENLNLGFTFGLRLQVPSRERQSHNILASTAISRVSFENESEETNENSEAALSLSLGYLYQYQAFQIGTFLGFDFIPGNKGRSWEYQGKPWLGVAIGFSLFSKDNSNNQDGQQ
ncbi:MAG: hypothetical protein AAF611_18340 [Bacteroidota bacterium]